eukprot:scaffold246792_cov33-Tisochrysis_lutea.AAC.2
MASTCLHTSTGKRKTRVVGHKQQECNDADEIGSVCAGDSFLFCAPRPTGESEPCDPLVFGALGCGNEHVSSHAGPSKPFVSRDRRSARHPLVNPTHDRALRSPRLPIGGSKGASSSRSRPHVRSLWTVGQAPSGAYSRAGAIGVSQPLKTALQDLCRIAGG